MKDSATAHNGSTKRGAGDLQHLLSDVEDLLTRVAHIKDADIDKVRQSLTDSIAAARESLVNTASSVQKRAAATVSSVDDYAHDSPWTLVGIAAFAGLSMGLLLSRR